MKSNVKTAAILIVAISLTATEAQACGELILRSLGTMRYHAFVTHHPAQILLYAGDGVVKHPPEYDVKIHDFLEKAGHKVVIVRGPEELANALAAHHYDVVIAPAEDMVGVTSRTTNKSSEPIVIPLLDNAADVRQMRERYPLVVTGNLNDLLKAIEQAMKALDA
jgi:ABC-type nitrate/sulfonate/bicarbonate transport system substrate-binding protein